MSKTNRLISRPCSAVVAQHPEDIQQPRPMKVTSGYQTFTIAPSFTHCKFATSSIMNFYWGPATLMEGSNDRLTQGRKVGTLSNTEPRNHTAAPQSGTINYTAQ